MIIRHVAHTIGCNNVIRLQNTNKCRECDKPRDTDVVRRLWNVQIQYVS